MIVRTATLSNGVRVITDEFRSIESASIGVVVEAGTRHEPSRLGGLAHFVEHMAFKGTERRKAVEITEEIESRGGAINACTMAEVTAYSCRVLKEDVDVAVDVLADIVCHATLPEDEFERERGVILSELGDWQDDHDRLLREGLYAAALPGTIGRHGLGSVESVKAITVADLRRYMAATHTGSQIVVAGSGNIDHDRFVAEVERGLGGLPVGTREVFAPAAFQSNSHTEVRGVDQSQFLMAFQGYSLGSLDSYAATNVCTALGGASSSRLFQELREKRGLCYHVGVSHEPFSDIGIVALGLSCQDECLQEAVAVLIGELRALSAGLLDQELATAKQIARAELLMGLERATERASLITWALCSTGKPFSVEEELDKISSVTHDDINRVIAHMFAHPPSIAVMGRSANLPTLDDVKALLSGG